MKRSWSSVPVDGMSFLHILQGSNKPYTQITVRLQETVHRQILHAQEANIIAVQLAFENAK